MRLCKENKNRQEISADILCDVGEQRVWWNIYRGSHSCRFLACVIWVSGCFAYNHFSRKHIADFFCCCCCWNLCALVEEGFNCVASFLPFCLMGLPVIVRQFPWTWFWRVFSVCSCCSVLEGFIPKFVNSLNSQGELVHCRAKQE